MASAAPTLTDDVPPLTGWALFGAAFTLALANFVVVLDTTIANVSVPHIAGGLAVSPTQGTWTITSYAVADAITVPLTGWLAARFGNVRWFMVSLIGFGTFSMLCGLSRSLDALIVFRVLQGLSGGPLMPLSQTLLMQIFPPRKRAIGLSLWAMTTTSAPIVGPIMGGWISDNWSWPWIFFINLPIVAICVWNVRGLLFRFNSRPVKARIDFVGLALLVLAVGAFQIMLDTGRDNDWFASRWIVSFAIVSAISFAAFIIWELTDAEPVVQLRVFRIRSFTAATVAVSLAYGAFFASIVLTPLWLQQYVGYTATESGMTVAWVGVLAVAMSPVAARLTGKTDLRLMVSGGIMWLAMVTLLRAGWTSGSDYWTLAFPQMLQGAGMPFFFIAVTALALSSVPARDQVSAAGLMSFTRTLSGAIGTAIVTTEWDNVSRTSRAGLVERMNGVPDALGTLIGRGMSESQARAYIERMVDIQAYTLGLVHLFLVAAVALVVAASVVWLAPKPKIGAPIPAAH